MSGGFEVGAAVPLRAFHRLPWDEGPEGEPHAHDYRIEVVVTRSGLDERGMVIDLDVLNRALGALRERLDGQDLDKIVAPPDAEAVTVEVLARWLHGELRGTLHEAGADALSVRVWESPDEFGGYTGPLATSA